MASAVSHIFEEFASKKVTGEVRFLTGFVKSCKCYTDSGMMGILQDSCQNHARYTQYSGYRL